VTGEQLPLDHLDPDAMEDRGARLRAELDALDVAKLNARTEALDAVTRQARLVRGHTAQLDESVAEARGFGATWKQIGEAAGIVASAAWERWAHRG
jgi:hypothetical protein